MARDMGNLLAEMRQDQTRTRRREIRYARKFAADSNAFRGPNALRDDLTARGILQVGMGWFSTDDNMEMRLSADGSWRLPPGVYRRALTHYAPPTTTGAGFYPTSYANYGPLLTIPTFSPDSIIQVEVTSQQLSYVGTANQQGALRILIDGALSSVVVSNHYVPPNSGSNVTYFCERAAAVPGNHTVQVQAQANTANAIRGWWSTKIQEAV